MSLDKNSIDKEISNPTAMLDLTTDISNNSTSIPTNELTTGVVISSKQEKEQCVELGFIEKLVELLRLTRKIDEAKSEILVSGILAKYTYRAGEAIMNKTMDYRYTYMANLLIARNKAVTVDEK